MVMLGCCCYCNIREVVLGGEVVAMVVWCLLPW